MWTRILPVLFFSLNAFAASAEPQVVCEEPQVWDRGYILQMTKTDDGGYAGNLQELKIFGRIPRYRGNVTIEVLAQSPNCVLQVTGAGGAFQLQINESGDDKLVSVNGQPADERDTKMNCHTTPEFDEYARHLCGE